MEYQKVIDLLDDTKNKPSKFRKRNWVEINYESRGKYDNSNIKFKTSMTIRNVCDYSDVYLHVKGTVTVPNTTGASSAVNNTNKKVIFIDCAPFSTWITEIYNTQVDDGQDSDIVMLMYNLIEYSDAYSKTLGCLWQYHRDEPAPDNNNNIIDFPANNNNSILSKLKQQITEQTGNGGTKNVQIMVPLKYLSNFWKTLEILLINCGISLNCKFITFVTLSTQDNVKLLKQLESGFKRTINWNKINLKQQIKHKTDVYVFN